MKVMKWINKNRCNIGFHKWDYLTEKDKEIVINCDYEQYCEWNEICTICSKNRVRKEILYTAI